MSSFVLKGDICYSENATTLHTLQGGYLVCAEGSSLGCFESLPGLYQDWPVYDYSNKLIIPGLVDLHTHAPQFTFRGLGTDLELLEWLNAYTFPEEARYRDLAYAEPNYQAVVRNFVAGPNTRVVIFASAHTEATLLLMDQMEQSGLVSYVGRVNMDRNAPDSLREADAEVSLQATREWLVAAAGRYRRTYPILTPRFVPCCTNALMNGIAKLQGEWNIPVQSHLAETLKEIEWVKELNPGCRHNADVFVNAGLLGGAATIMAHCVWCDEDETRVLKQSGAFIAHCPQSNANISSGIAPIRRYMREGLNVGLASDVAGGMQTSIFRAIADAVVVSKLRWRLVDTGDMPLTFAEAFYLATIGGGAFFGRVGSFRPGYEFDALVLDDEAFSTSRTVTLAERLERFAYLSDDRHIAQKYVRGEALFAPAST